MALVGQIPPVEVLTREPRSASVELCEEGVGVGDRGTSVSGERNENSSSSLARSSWERVFELSDGSAYALRTFWKSSSMACCLGLKLCLRAVCRFEALSLRRCDETHVFTSLVSFDTACCVGASLVMKVSRKAFTQA